eukprot:6407876-Alexandrium_andersonii.AAC.1
MPVKHARNNRKLPESASRLCSSTHQHVQAVSGSLGNARNCLKAPESTGMYLQTIRSVFRPDRHWPFGVGHVHGRE